MPIALSDLISRTGFLDPSDRPHRQEGTDEKEDEFPVVHSITASAKEVRGPQLEAAYYQALDVAGRAKLHRTRRPYCHLSSVFLRGRVFAADSQGRLGRL